MKNINSIKKMKIGIPRERFFYESRVAATPETVKKMKELGFDVVIEKNAGLASDISNEEYLNVGAVVKENVKDVYFNSDIVLKVQQPCSNKEEKINEVSLIPKGSIVISMLNSANLLKNFQIYEKLKITFMALELIPRIARAQSMDVLSSQNNLAGYKSVLEGANQLNRVLPMMMTAAGTIPPSKVLILGAGVAGLQAIATAKRLGAVVSVFDVRSSTKEQVHSLGANFIEVDFEENAENKEGYALEMSNSYKKRQSVIMHNAIKKSDLVISTALVYGKKAPILITKNMIDSMKIGSVIMDLAIEAGGNCVLSKRDKIVNYKGIKIISFSNLTSKVSHVSSSLYARNIFQLIDLMYKKEENKFCFEDKIIDAITVVKDGKLKNENLNIEE
jgi:NAD(P) transhydrogenase subunit alpha